MRWRPSGWRIGCWLCVLLAALGGAQYLRHGAWPYLAACLILVVLCAGALLRQAWARQPLRLALLAVACWALASGLMMLARWHQFDTARAHARAQPAWAPMLLAMIDDLQRAFLLSLVFKALLLALTLWLAWALGRPDTRAAFVRHATTAGRR